MGFPYVFLHLFLVFRRYLVVSSQLSIDSYYVDQLLRLQSKEEDLLIVDSCKDHNYTKRCNMHSQKEYAYPELLHDSTFCLVFRGEHMGQFILLEAMASNCIPVIVIDGAVMPFSEVIDWKRAAIFIMEDYLNTLMDVLKDISFNKIQEMQRQVKFLYERYFRSLGAIVETSLDIIQDRVYPHWGRTYDDWNIAPSNVINVIKMWNFII